MRSRAAPGSRARAPPPHSADPEANPHTPTEARIADHPDDLTNKLTSLCKQRGFIFQSSEIYGRTGAVYDYGPLGWS